VFYEVDQDALALLRAAKEHHDWLEPGEPFSEVREPKAASLEGRWSVPHQMFIAAGTRGT
jgi:hypothetical protein